MSQPAASKRLEIAQRFLLNIGHPNVAESVAFLAPDVSYRVPGTHRMAGTYTGLEQVTQHLEDLVDRTTGTFDAVKWEDWLLGEYHVAAFVHIHVQTRGSRYSGRVVYTLRFNAADLIDLVEVFVEDERAFSEFFGP